MEQLYTTKSLASLLQVSPSTIRREIDEGRINWFKVRGQIRFRETDVQRYLRGGRFRGGRSNMAEIIPMPLRPRIKAQVTEIESFTRHSKSGE